MPRIRTMTTRFIDGEPNGARICRCAFSTMTTVFLPRKLISRLKKVPNIPHRGLCYLMDDSDGFVSHLFIGQTTVGIDCLDEYEASRGFWNKAFLFLLDDKQHFTPATMNDLERYALDMASQSERRVVESDIDPHHRLSERRLPHVLRVYDEIAFVMGTFGYDLEVDDAPIEDFEFIPKIVFSISRRGVKARGRYMGGTFDVLSGSTIDLNKRPRLDCHERLRQRLLVSGAIVRRANNRGLLVENVSLDSPSAAADFVLGGSNDGWEMWKDDSHRTLREVCDD